jgi:ribosomal protein L13E
MRMAAKEPVGDQWAALGEDPLLVGPHIPHHPRTMAVVMSSVAANRAVATTQSPSDRGNGFAVGESQMIFLSRSPCHQAGVEVTNRRTNTGPSHGEDSEKA